MPMTRSFKLDKTDWRILHELQQDGRITNVALAEKAGISPPPCLRRVRTLEEQGIISGYRAILDAEKLGFELTMFAMVGLHSQAEHDLVAFEEQVRQWPIVRECYMLSGEVDFILKCVASDLHTAQEFVIRDLTKASNVDSVKTTLTLRVSKYEPGVPMTRDGPVTI
jgi:DNA-binding Lrp family transcriptional regulator